MKRVVTGQIALVFVALAGAASAQLKDENLLLSMPPGFKVATNQTRGGVVFQEWIPAAENFPNWSEMVTTQILLGRGDIDGLRYLGDIRQGWLRACPETRSNTIVPGRLNGYPIWSLTLQCPRLAGTGKPETTLFRSFKGRDSFYSVQRTSRSMPDAGQLRSLQAFVDSALVCDTRAAEHACPDLMKPGGQPGR